MARLYLDPGQTFSTVGAGLTAATDVIGTNDHETVFLSADADANFDPSFNRGGDILNIAGIAGLYHAALSGSNLLLTSTNGATILIPVGTVGATINFANASRELVVTDGKVFLGSQEITSGAGVDVTNGTGAVTDTHVTFANSLTGTADTLRITGDHSVRVDLTHPGNQITGIDKNGDGLIALDGNESGKGVNLTPVDDGKDYQIIDAYVRNRTNYYDATQNFLGNLYHDGTGHAGDGTNTNGNVVLGGLGADIIFGGIGNDFLVGGGVLPAIPHAPTGDPLVDLLQDALNKLGSQFDYDYKEDALSGGRNADFFFADFSTLSFAEGDSLFIDGGTTADDTSAVLGGQFDDDFGGQFSSQDSDWFLFEASDDEEPLVVELREGDNGRIYSEDAVSDIYANIYDIENFDASGNLYGFVDGSSARLGEDGQVVNGENVGIGTSAQLLIEGSEANNIIIGGYDNDRIYGGEGDDLLFGGNLKYALNNPNAAGIINDGKDQLFGGEGNDSIVFEADNGKIDGASGHDVLYLTSQSLGTKGVTDLVGDGVLRFDLLAQNLNNSAGYGGADVNGTQDQSNYTGASRVTITDMDGVIASGLGAIDYKAAGGNSAEDVAFRNQQNHLGYEGALSLRGDDNDNELYASRGNFNDIIEGREGNDFLSGGDGNDDFIFSFGSTVALNNTPQTVAQDGVDIIWSQRDADGDNIWDTLDAAFLAAHPNSTFVAHSDQTDTSNGFATVVTGDRYWDTDGDGIFDVVAYGVPEDVNAAAALGAKLYAPDFGQVGDTVFQNSKLTLFLDDVAQPANVDDLTNFPVDGVIFGLSDTPTSAVTQYTVSIAPSAVQGTYAQFVAGLNAALHGTPALANLQAVLQPDNHTIVITDPDGHTFHSVGYTFVNDQVPANGNLVFQQKVGAPTESNDLDRIVYTSYEDRADGEKRDDDAVLGSNISLGPDGYAEDLVASFGKEGTRLAEDQQYTINFKNLTTQDKLTVEVNGVTYTQQVGVDVDGNIIKNEDGPFDNQVSIEGNFLNRFAAYINTFGDDDTAAGAIDASAIDTDGDGKSDALVITQRAYNGEETVFMVSPEVLINNLSKGETATYTVTNNAAHEVLLFGYNGRDNNLNSENVVFVGDTGISRSTLETALDAGQTIVGKNALVIDNLVDNIEGVNGLGTVRNSPTEFITDSQATNASVKDEVYTVHGDDFLIGGKGNDIISGGTGDDRIVGSLGTDTLDGGKNYYTVQVAGEPKLRVYELNKWEAANFTIDGKSYVTTLVRDYESGVGPANSGIYDDTLLFQQADFTAGQTRFTITLNDFEVDGKGVVQLKHDGAGTVQTDVNGDGDFADTDENKITTFTNFENIRTVSGVGNATADYTDTAGNKVAGGQGRDTLNVAALSTATGGILYDLTNDAGAGSVLYSVDKLTGAPAPHSLNTDYESLVLKVDGVENVIGGLGNDVIIVDETEAAKDNVFDGGVASGVNNGVDRVEYQNNYGPNVAEPTVTVTVNSAADTDTVQMTGGRLGTVVATDTLKSIEFITVGGNTAQGTSENDVIDVTKIAGGAVVDYTNGKISDNSGNVQLVIENIVQFEVVNADGNDTVIVADADQMSQNTGADTNSKDIAFSSYLDYDTFAPGNTGVRVPFASQGSAQVSNVNNPSEFRFNLGQDTDRVDYSKADDQIAAVVAVNAGTNYVLVNGNGSDDVYDDSKADRIDAMTGVEQIVASTGESILDLTGLGQNSKIDFQYDPTKVIAGKDRLESTVRIADGNGNQLAGIPNYIEYYDLNKDGNVQPFANATWSRIEGSDFDEMVSYDGSEDLVNQNGLDHRFSEDTLTLRGGNNGVSYFQLETSIEASIGFSAYDKSDPTNTGLIEAEVNFEDGSSNPLAGSKTHTITSYSQAHDPIEGFLKLEASQDAEDKVSFQNDGIDKDFLLGYSPGVIDVFVDGEQDMRLTGFEFFNDAATNDVYDFANINVVATALKFADTIGDQDTLKVGYDAADVAYGGSTSEIDLAGLNTYLTGKFGTPTQFDVLDVTRVDNAALTTLVGTNNPDAEVVIGKLGNITAINDFASTVFTQATVTESGASYNYNSDTNKLAVGGKTVTYNNDAHVFSFAGEILDGQFGHSSIGSVPSVTTGITFVATGAGAVEVYGGDGNDTITGAGGNDVFFGGKGADTLDGGVTAAVGATLVFTIPGAGTTSGTAAGNGGVRILDDSGAVNSEDLTTVVTPTTPNEIAQNADADQIGSKFAGESLAVYQEILANGAATPLTAAEASALQSVTYDATANTLTFKFAADANGSTITAADLTNTLLIAADGNAVFAPTHVETGFVAQAESADTFLYTGADQSNEAGMDTIKNFTAGAVDDVINFTGVITGGVLGDVVGKTGAVATFADAKSAAAGIFATAEVALVHTATDAYVFIDADNNGLYSAANDLVIKLAGIASIANFDGNNFIGDNNYSTIA